ncbi:MAG: sigma-70 family RNA polymerase sigma factor [Myxococcota bacterium]
MREGWYDGAVSPARAAALFAGIDDRSVGAGVLEAMRDAQAEHPELEADDASFLAHLGALCDGDPARLSDLALSDLWLAFATASGCARALQVFERDVFGPRIDAMRRRFGDDPTIEDEAQTLRLRLVAEVEPLLRRYRGRGSLQGWVSVTLARAVSRARARRSRSSDELDALGDALVDQLDVPGVAERAEAKAILTAALQASVAEIDPAHRVLLKLHICDGLVIDELAQLLGVHRATASRRLERARRMLADAVRTRIKGAHGLDSAQVDSLLRNIRSSFQSVMATFLAS